MPFKNIKESRKYSREWYHKNKKRTKKSRQIASKKWRESHKEEIIIRIKKYRKDNLELLKKKAKLKFEEKKIYLYKLLGNKCKRCPEKNQILFDLDHIKSDGKNDRTKKGNRKSNSFYYNNPNKAIKVIQILCVKCHRLKTNEESWNR